MGSVDRVDDRTFKVNFTGEGAAKLRNTVEEKLKEFMGDYTDETLVEYVIVLLRNGRNKEEARNELDVFLGDDSDSFVSWLWDHLASSLYLYIPAKEPDVGELMPILELDGRNGLRNIDVDSERNRSSNLSRSHHNGEQKGLAGDAAEPPLILKSEVQKVNEDERLDRRVDRAKRSGSPRRPMQKKRTRADEHPQRESEHKDIDAPRRLLQFAVRDAVRTPKSDSATDSASKRLRSVVSTSFSDIPQVDRPQRRVPNSMATVIRAVAEAAEDTRRTKGLGSVFDRLGRGAQVMDPKFPDHREAAIDDEDYPEFNHIPVAIHPRYAKQHSRGDMTMMVREPKLVSGYPSASDRYGEVSLRRRNIVSQINAPVGTRGGDSPIMQHNVVNKSGEGMVEQNKDELPVASNTFRRTANSHTGVSTWKPTSQYRAQSELTAPHGQKPLQRSTVAAARLNAPDVKRNDGPVSVSVANGNGNPAAESLKLQSSSGLPIHVEDAELRSIFVNNVHTAATKDNLSHHFSKCGEVVKVVINTDATTGQPVGSAVIEFMGKEAADNSLSLDGTSFMSRVIKVVKWSPPGGVEKWGGATVTAGSSQPRAGAVGARSSGTMPYAAWYPPRSPYARGGGVFRGGGRRGGGGARSFQWKREDSTVAAEAAATSVNTTTPPPPFPAARRFTYVRTETKPDAT